MTVSAAASATTSVVPSKAAALIWREKGTFFRTLPSRPNSVTPVTSTTMMPALDANTSINLLVLSTRIREPHPVGATPPVPIPVAPAVPAPPAPDPPMRSRRSRRRSNPPAPVPPDAEPPVPAEVDPPAPVPPDAEPPVPPEMIRRRPRRWRLRRRRRARQPAVPPAPTFPAPPVPIVDAPAAPPTLFAPTPASESAVPLEAPQAATVIDNKIGHALERSELTSPVFRRNCIAS